MCTQYKVPVEQEVQCTLNVIEETL